MLNDNNLRDKFIKIIDSAKFRLSDVSPSVWAEQNMRITTGQYQGRLSYDLTPYWREIIDNLGPNSGFTEVILMGGAQLGKTKAIIEAIINYYISQHPRNIGYFTGQADLSEDSVISLDAAIDACGNKSLISAQSQRKRNSRTGDTNRIKEFPLGKLWAGSANNHKILRQKDVQFAIGDDIEAAKSKSNESGSTVDLIRLRTNSFGLNKKIFWCSTPENLVGSIINELYLTGDCCKWHIPCEHCGTGIELQFEVKVDNKEKAGLHWRVDEAGKLVPGSVEYICQSCGNPFSEKNKYEFNLAGLWVPSQEPDSIEFKSYHMSGLYSPPGMDSWEVIVREYLSAGHNENKLRTLWNLRLGLPFTPMGKSLSASKIFGNTRKYSAGIIPQDLSLADLNGNIILVTCGADLNGWDNGNGHEDVRLDWEVTAHSESGSTYSIAHGSIGTWIRGGKDDKNRQKWTCELNKPNCVWAEFDKIIGKRIKSDCKEEFDFLISIAGIDTGAFRNYVLTYLDSTPHYEKVVGLRGYKENQKFDPNLNSKFFTQGRERSNEYFLQVGFLKDELAGNMRLTWNPNGETEQPPNFMNFPDRDTAMGMYQMDNYFSHFESEHRVLDAGKYIWQKKNSASVNHMWDCAVYNLALKNIMLNTTEKSLKKSGYMPQDYNFAWPDYADFIMDRRFTKKIR